MKYWIGVAIGIVVATILMIAQWTVLPVDGRGLVELLGGLAMVSLIVGLVREIRTTEVI